MKALDLNLASRPFRNNMLVWGFYVVLFSVVTGFTYWNVSSYRHYRSELTTLNIRHGNFEQDEQDLRRRHRSVLSGVGKYNVRAIRRRTTKANEVIAWKAFSWTRLLNRLAEVLPNKAKMVSIKPSFRERTRDTDADGQRHGMPVVIEGLARDYNGAFEFEANLQAHESFGDLRPKFMTIEDYGEVKLALEFLYYPDEVAEPEEEPLVAELEAEPAAETDDLNVTADRSAPDESAPAASRRELPVAVPEPSEVTDEWAAPTVEAQNRAKDGEAKRSGSPQRRTLPKATPSSDEEGSSL